MTSNEERKGFHLLLDEELERATKKFGKFNTFHEGYAVMLEEMEELWDSIKRNNPDPFELIQLAAMCARMWQDNFGYSVHAEKNLCSNCNGEGTIGPCTCIFCKGTGRKNQNDPN